MSFSRIAPQGAVASLENGGTNQVTESYDYNNRLQLVRSQLKAAGSQTDIACAVYNYYAGVANPASCAIPTQGSGDDGNVAGRFDQDNVNTSLSHTAAFAYDAEHRLTAAAATGNATYNLAYVYDQYGDMTCQQNKQTQGLCPQYGFNGGTNQINNSGFSYDASGDLLSDNSHYYQYDAEHRLILVDRGWTASYVYNALGERVEKNAGGSYTEYVFGQARQPMGEYNRSAWTDSWVTFEGRHFAHFSNGDTYFVHADHIGTTNIVTDWNSGTVVQDELHYPWGQVWTSAGQSVEERFAGLQHRDGESNLDPTEYRMFSSDVGRWTTPDPADQMSATPTDPQTFNRYAYVLNGPLSGTDSFGLSSCMFNNGSWSCNIPNYFNDSYNGGAPSYNPTTTANTWMGQNTGIYDPSQSVYNNNTNTYNQINGTTTPGSGFISSSCSPGAGSLSQRCNPGYQGGGELNLGYSGSVNGFECDNGYGTDCASGTLGYDNAYTGGNSCNNYGPIGSCSTNPYKWMETVPSPPVVFKPSVPCSSDFGKQMLQWSAALLAWVRAHPGQPTSSFATASPSYFGGCP